MFYKWLKCYTSFPLTKLSRIDLSTWTIPTTHEYISVLMNKLYCSCNFILSFSMEIRLSKYKSVRLSLSVWHSFIKVRYRNFYLKYNLYRNNLSSYLIISKAFSVLYSLLSFCWLYQQHQRQRVEIVNNNICWSQKCTWRFSVSF